MPLPHVDVGDDHYGYSMGMPITPVKTYQVTVGNTAKDIPTLLGEAIPDGVKHFWIDPEAEVTATFVSTETPVVGTLGIRIGRDILMMNQADMLDGMKLIAGSDTKVNLALFS
jgi:hypothetical protein